ncbi:MAG TPA: oleate hydratase [Actinospica sp.]|jgi:oleate hydratase|nr:oleate hydratase [Actinospica sp.]
MAGPGTRDRFLLVGGGIASLAAAAFLIRDAGVPGDRIRILEAAARPGGALRSGALADRPDLFLGNAVRAMDEDSCACLWDLLGSVPVLSGARMSVLDDIRAAHREAPVHARARLIGADHRVAEPDPHLDETDRACLAALLTNGSERELAARRVDQVLPAHLLATDFWILWSTTYRLGPGSNALDLKTSLMRHLHDLPRLPTLSGLRRARRSEHQSIIRPLHSWLLGRGVAFTHGATVTDLDFADDGAGGRRATSLRLTVHGVPDVLELGAHDHVLATLGSIAANAAHGDDEHPPEPGPGRRDHAWSLWESIARKRPDFGRPDAFTAHVADTAWLSFTLTSRTPDLTWYISHLTGNREGTGGLVTFRDSPWLLTIAVPRQPYFTGQPPGTHTVLGYGMRFDARGDHAPVTMLEADGRQVVEELVGQLGFGRGAAIVRATTSAVSVLLPYAGSPLSPRAPGDRPEPVPAGARNFAFLGQFVEIPGHVAFSMEYSVLSAMHAVYGLLGIDREIPRARPDTPDPAAARRALEEVSG